jgi:dCMP deaminase
MLSNKKAMKFMEVAKSIAEQFSKDTSTKVGALVTSMDGSPLSWGYNGMPRGVNDNVPERMERPEKYLWMEHAERNAIFNACRSGTSLMGSRIFVTGLVPCMECARGIIQSGIKEIYLEKRAFDNREQAHAWAEGFPKTMEMLAESDVRVALCGPLQMYMNPVFSYTADKNIDHLSFLHIS